MVQRLIAWSQPEVGCVDGQVQSAQTWVPTGTSSRLVPRANWIGQSPRGLGEGISKAAITALPTEPSGRRSSTRAPSNVLVRSPWTPGMTTTRSPARTNTSSTVVKRMRATDRTPRASTCANGQIVFGCSAQSPCCQGHSLTPSASQPCFLRPGAGQPSIAHETRAERVHGAS